ncbi:MAG: glycine--tRNA ligase subunit beta [Thiomonas sp.]
MPDASNLLVELFTEELPPKALPALGRAFADGLADRLKAQGLAAADAVVTPYASPRRLAAHITGVCPKAADKAVAQKLMPASVGLDARGAPTPALLKKLGALGLDAAAVPQLRREGEGKAETLFIDTVAAGSTLAAGLQTALNETLAKLPIPKVMAYQLLDGWSTVKFVRPAHGLVALHGANVVPVEALGLQSGRSTHGHRFEAQIDPIVLPNADSYATTLREQGAVIASFEERRAEIERQLQAAAGQVTDAAGAGLRPIDDAALLDEVTALVERPNVLLCQFDRAFLDVPQECLILTMKANQKYFPLLDAAGKLTNQFLVVSNIHPADPSAVIEGNERVVRPRLADAQFFFNQDRKRTLESRVPGLDKVVYHAKLGSQGERMQRVRTIARSIATQLGWPAERVKLVDRAALLAKTDLLTDMVGEFPELQGIMGRYYAAHDGESALVAEAIEDHYKPRFAGDELPRNGIGIVVALADKLETLVGMFGIGNLPTGDKDPFALRRHALGVVRVLAETSTKLSQRNLLEQAVNSFPDDLIDKNPKTEGVPLWKVLDIFLNERAVGYWAGFGHPESNIDAVLDVCDDPSDMGKRLEAVRAFSALPEAQALAAANKRVGNILKKSETSVDGKVLTENQLVEPAEIALAQALAAIAPQADAAYAQGDYTSALKALAALKDPVDAFFDTVMVNADDPALRANRLALLARLQAAMNRVADLSRLAS